MIDISYIKQLLSRYLVFSTSFIDEDEYSLEFQSHSDVLEAVDLLAEYKQQDIIDCYIMENEVFKLRVEIL